VYSVQERADLAAEDFGCFGNAGRDDLRILVSERVSEAMHIDQVLRPASGDAAKVGQAAKVADGVLRLFTAEFERDRGELADVVVEQLKRALQRIHVGQKNLLVAAPHRVGELLLVCT